MRTKKNKLVEISDYARKEIANTILNGEKRELPKFLNEYFLQGEISQEDVTTIIGWSLEKEKIFKSYGMLMLKYSCYSIQEINNL